MPTHTPKERAKRRKKRPIAPRGRAKGRTRETVTTDAQGVKRKRKKV